MEHSQTETHTSNGNTRRDGDAAPVTVAEAARRLGITPRAVRARIKRGTLAAFAVPGPKGNEWRVTLGTEEGPGVRTGNGTPHFARRIRDNGDAATALAAEVEWLRGQVNALTAMLQAEQQARRDSEQVRAALEARLLGVLPAGDAQTVDSTMSTSAATDAGHPAGNASAEQPSRRRWWFFRRS